MNILSIFCLGVVLGTILTNIVWRYFLVGKLHIDTSDPDDQPYMFLELSKNVGSVIGKSYIVLKVDTKNFISHK